MSIASKLASIASSFSPLGLAQFGYGIYQDQRDSRKQDQARRDQLAAQQWQQNFSQQTFDRQFAEQQYLNRNMYQMKVADMQAAGLHPSLAAGVTPHAAPAAGAPAGGGAPPQTPSHSPRRSGITEGAMLSAQKRLLDAQADDARASAAQRTAEAERTRGATPIDARRDDREERAIRMTEQLHTPNLEAIGLSNRHLANRIDMQPAEYAALLLDNIQREANIDRTRQQTRLTSAQVSTERMRELQVFQETARTAMDRERLSLEVASGHLRIRQHELENMILLHNTERILASDFRSDDFSDTAHIDRFLRGLNLDMNDTAARTLRTVLQAIDYAADTAIRIRGSNRPAVQRNRTYNYNR